MLKRFYVLVLLGILALLGGCSWGSTKDQLPPCFFPDGSGKEAPRWVCGEASDAFALQAVGVSDYSRTGSSFMRQAAHNEAKSAMVRTLRHEVTQWVAALVALNPELQAQLQPQIIRSLLSWMPDDPIRNLAIDQQQETPSGGMVVSVQLPSSDLRYLKRRAMWRSITRDYPLWQEFLGPMSVGKVMHDLNRL